MSGIISASHQVSLDFCAFRFHEVDTHDASFQFHRFYLDSENRTFKQKPLFSSNSQTNCASDNCLAVIAIQSEA